MFPVKFLFCTEMTGSAGLHHDCISLIVSRFTTFTENFVICCYEVTKIFCPKYGSAIARGPYNLVPWQISHYRSFGKCVSTLCLPKSTLLVGAGSKDGSWEELECDVSLCVQKLCHPRDFLWILAAIPVCRNTTGRHVLYRCFRFYLVLDFCLAWATTGRPVLFVQHVLDTGNGWEAIPLRSSRLTVT